MMRAILSLYHPRFAKTVVYMLQATEYQVRPYLEWFWRTSDFSHVMHRKTLVKTRKARLMLIIVAAGIAGQEVASVIAFGLAIFNQAPLSAILSLALFIIAPVLWAHLAVVPLLIGDHLVTKPYVKSKVRQSRGTFAAHKGVRIAVAGSYGKTTMKEILLSILAEGRRVAATPANKNVAASHAQFAKSLKGDEEILIIEYGEGAPGDVAAFAKNTKPNVGIITGLAPAHLDKYKTLKAAGEDIFSLADYLGGKRVYVNGESEATEKFIKKGYKIYGHTGVGDWKVSNVKANVSGLSFDMKRLNQTLKIKSGLLGEHQIGPLALAAALAVELGLTKDQVEKAATKVIPFEHRMQPRQVSGAWIIDDTYNGNIDGMLAGLKLLAHLSAKRKIYVTPGLVDQGEESPKIHQKLGRVIAESSPDMVVLMKNSVTNDIIKGLSKAGYEGEVKIEKDPLTFYTNIDQIIAAGDLILMQNDWPDNYN